MWCEKSRKKERERRTLLSLFPSNFDTVQTWCASGTRHVEAAQKTRLISSTESAQARRTAKSTNSPFFLPFGTRGTVRIF